MADAEMPDPDTPGLDASGPGTPAFASSAADARELATVAAITADAKQGKDVIVLDVGDVLGITDYFVVTSAPNRRLVRTIVDEVEMAVRAATGRSPLRTEGSAEQQWVLIDYGDVVVHVFLDEIRRFYEIERLYRDVPRVEVL